MNTKSKNTAVLAGAMMATALLVGPSFATAQTQRPPADTASYAFKVARAANGTVRTIQLIDTSTSQPVAGADIAVVRTLRPAYAPPQKAALNIQRAFVPVQDYLRGKCAHPQSETAAGRELTVMATVPGRHWPVWGTVDLGK